MRSNNLRMISIVLLLLAISTTAHAGSTISDSNYWPAEARPDVYGTSAVAHDPSSAFASTAAPQPNWVTPEIAPDEGFPRYHGGPKFNDARD